jgi:hypothetical protein
MVLYRNKTSQSSLGTWFKIVHLQLNQWDSLLLVEAKQLKISSRNPSNKRQNLTLNQEILPITWINLIMFINLKPKRSQLNPNNKWRLLAGLRWNKNLAHKMSILFPRSEVIMRSGKANWQVYSNHKAKVQVSKGKEIRMTLNREISFSRRSGVI